MLNPSPTTNRPGRPLCLSSYIEQLIVYRMKLLALMGFSCSVYALKSAAAKIAAAFGTLFAGDLPSDDWVRAFRSRHRYVCLRNAESKDVRKIQAESKGHVPNLKKALEQVEADHPAIFSDPMLLWNMDETEVSGAYGTREKVFGSFDTNHKGYKGVCGKGIGKQLTAVLCTSAAGHTLPPFLIFEGKY